MSSQQGEAAQQNKSYNEEDLISYLDEDYPESDEQYTGLDQEDIDNREYKSDDEYRDTGVDASDMEYESSDEIKHRTRATEISMAGDIGYENDGGPQGMEICDEDIPWTGVEGIGAGGEDEYKSAKAHNRGAPGAKTMHIQYGSDEIDGRSTRLMDMEEDSDAIGAKEDSVRPSGDPHSGNPGGYSDDGPTKSPPESSNNDTEHRAYVSWLADCGGTPGSESSYQESDIDPADDILHYQDENSANLDTDDEHVEELDMLDLVSETGSTESESCKAYDPKAPIVNYEDFPYSSVPHVEIERKILRQIHLLQLRMDGNVADVTHGRYVDAFNRFYEEDSINDEPGIGEEAKARDTLASVTNINHVRYDVCRNNCICYAAFPSSQECHMCGEPWRDEGGKPLRTFDYIPLIHCLRLLCTDPRYIERTMKYKTSEWFQNAVDSEEPQTTTQDFWDSVLCSVLRKQCRLWKDPRDIGFIFSTDGFSLFKVGVFDVWPLLLINANLPPNERVFKRNMTLSGIIPGPENPKDLGSFLTPLIDELVLLQNGIKAWDGLRKEEFTLRAHIVLVAGDTMAMAKLMKWTGPNSYHYCRFCDVYGISAGHIYCPLEPPRDQMPKVPQADPGPGDSTTKKKKKPTKKERFFPERAWDPENLPIYSDATLRSNQKTVENKMDFVWDVMHLVDENTPRLYLTHWMGVFEQKQNPPAEGSSATNPSGTKGQRGQQKGKKNRKGKGKKKVKERAQKKKGKQRETQTGAAAPEITPETTEKPFGGERYILSTRTWSLIGKEISDSRRSIPTAFGKAIRDISKYHASYKASELLNFMHLVSPIVLNGRLPEDEYSHWHHLVLSTEKTRQYKLSIEEIEEMGEDMVKSVTDYERLYYQYKRGRLSSCTSQVHGLLHLLTAMRVCGPNPIYHQYPMERMCGFIKSMNHSRSSPNRNLSIGILEAERLKFLPYIAKIPERLKPTSPQEVELEIAAGTKLFGLSPKDKHEFPDSYPEYLLMLPKAFKILNQYERGHLRKFCLSLTEDKEIEPITTSMRFTIWSRAVCGRAFSNESAYEIIGSLLSNTGRGAIDHTKRDDSYIRYAIRNDYNQDISYFGRVLYYLPHKVVIGGVQFKLLLAYVQ